MMGMPKRPLTPAARVEGALDRLDRGALQRGPAVHRRQQAGQPRRQHRLAAAGRPDHQQRVLAGRGDLQRAPCLGLAPDVGEIGVRRWRPERRRGRRRQRLSAVDMGTYRQQVVGGEHPRVLDTRGLGRAVPRQHQGAAAVGGLPCQCQGTTHRPQSTGQRQLAGELVLRQCATVDLARRRQDAQRDRQIETATLLRQIGRRQIDRDAPLGKIEAAGLQRGTHPVAGLAHLGVGQADQRERRQTVGQMGFDDDLGRRHAIERPRVDQGERHGRLRDGIVSSLAQTSPRHECRGLAELTCAPSRGASDAGGEDWPARGRTRPTTARSARTAAGAVPRRRPSPPPSAA